ncbi:urease subunit beta [uncultured Halomonas sp.]|uniref:urease subunit beta n=1 Tax=uncultured Halomonas sp. TaxID=173971 RepID=UPI00344ACD85
MAADSPKAEHASDAPGYKIEKRTRSSGAHSPSEPRRPGSGARQAPRRESMGRLEESDPLVPGEVLYGEGDVEINAGQPITTIRVINAADRPVQVGSHYHFAEANEALEFDREAAWGKRLNVLSGGAVRFEPGAVEEVELIPIRGRRIVPGLRGLCRGGLDG